jgi:hypothetical protein
MQAILSYGMGVQHLSRRNSGADWNGFSMIGGAPRRSLFE